MLLTLLRFGLVALCLSSALEGSTPAQEKPAATKAAFRIPDETIRWAKELAVAESKPSENLKSRRPKGLEDLESPAAIRRAWLKAKDELRDDSNGEVSQRMRYLGEAVFDDLVTLAKSDDPKLAGAACSLLGDRGAKAVEPLTQALLNSPHETVRQEAANVLRQLCQPQAVPALIKALEDRPRVRISAISDLSYLRGKRAIEPLTQHRADPGYAHSVKSAIESIQSPAGPYWPPELLEHWPLCRDAGTLAGERFGKAEIDRILKHCGSPHAAVAGTSVRALGELHVTSAVPALLKLPRSWDTTLVLARLATPPAIDELVIRITTRSQEARVELQPFADGAGRWAAPLLFALLDDDSLKVPAYTEKGDELVGDTDWPESHLAHRALCHYFAKFGHLGEIRNLYVGQTNNVPEEMTQLRKWWKQHGRDFVAGKDTPNPNLSNVIYNDP